MGGVSTILFALKTPCRIPDSFDLPEQLVYFVAHHEGDKFAAQTTIAMLARERTPVLFYQYGRIGQYFAKFLLSPRSF